MADYINENILCQAYIHVEPDEITDELLDELKSKLNIFVRSRAEFFLYPNADIDISLKDGSIKVYATILGTVGMLYSGVSEAPSFKEGATLMYEDVKRLSDNIATESIFLTQSKHNQVIHVEARTGVIGSIKKIITQLDSIQSKNGQVFADTLAKYIFKAADDIQTLLSKLNTDKDKVLIKKGLNEQISKLPKRPTPPEKKTNSSEQLKSYDASVKYIQALLLKTDSLQVEVDKESLESVLNQLNKQSIAFRVKEKPSDESTVKPRYLEIILSPEMWGAFALVLIALIKVKHGRKIKITNKNGETIDIKGITKDELVPTLKEAKKLSVVTNDDGDDNDT